MFRERTVRKEISSVSNIYIYISMYIFSSRIWLAKNTRSGWRADPGARVLHIVIGAANWGAMDSLVIKVQVNGNLFIINQSALMNYYP